MIFPGHSWNFAEENFEDVCFAMSEVQLFSAISVFSWKALEALHLCHVVAKVILSTSSYELINFFKIQKYRKEIKKKQPPLPKKKMSLKKTFSSDLGSVKIR